MINDKDAPFMEKIRELLSAKEREAYDKAVLVWVKGKKDGQPQDYLVRGSSSKS